MLPANIHRFASRTLKKGPGLALRVTRETFLQVPVRYRRDMKIPAWFPDEFGIPRFLLRKKSRFLTYRQKILAMIARMYYIWIFQVSPHYEGLALTTSMRVRISHCDGISSLLRQTLRTKYWYAGAATLHGKLKVLLSPARGW